MSDYWEECIAEAAESCGADLTAEQIAEIAGWAESGHENYSQAHGHDVASTNLSAERRQETERLKLELQREKDKVTCRECQGTGNISTYGPVHSSFSSCWKCSGTGRVDL